MLRPKVALVPIGIHSDCSLRYDKAAKVMLDGEGLTLRMLPNSIRWRLPLSYAVIALLAALALGSVLLTTLRAYYAEQEYASLEANAAAIQSTVAQMYQSQLQPEQIQSQLQSLAFLTQTRIRILNANGAIVVDSGDNNAPQMVALTYNAGMPQPFIMHQAEDAQMSQDISIWHRETFSGPAGVGIMGYTSINLVQPPQTYEVRSASFNSPVITGSAAAGGGGERILMPVSGTQFGFGLSGNNIAISDRRSDQLVSLPLTGLNDQFMGYVELSGGPAYGTDIVDGVARALVSAALVAIVLAIGVGWLISRYLSDPILKLTAATRRMAEGDLAVRVKLTQQDEFGLLASSFNHMARRVENTVITLRRFVADAAHELHTPITALHANLELAATEENPRVSVGFIKQAQEQLKRLEAMTAGLLDLSRLEAGELHDERTIVDMTALIAEVSELYASRAEQLGVSFHFDAPTPLAQGKITARVNEAQLRRVVGNLLDNAIKFTPENGDIHIGLRREGNLLKLWVQDTGIGIPAEDLPYLFNRFRRARNAAAYPGSGLGLAIIKTIIEGHQGAVGVESSEQGTRFSLQLPLLA
ncbi:MAG: HAMP domain-containing histidine kinase [Anaerolineae bacterium]|nr:HAMP domain-containing histidine kinase [Anaerolineae bacterium]